MMKDYLGSKYHAGILAKRIKESWDQRGIDVEVWVEPIPTYPDLYQVRSSIKFGKIEADHARSR